MQRWEKQKKAARDLVRDGTTTLARRLHSVGGMDRHAVELLPENQDQPRTLSPSQPCPYMVTHVSDLSVHQSYASDLADAEVQALFSF
jgi:hypothetical protein